MRTLLAFASVVEAATGLVLLAAPALVVTLLLGGDVSREATLLGRFLGIALLALGVACWPGRKHSEKGSPALRGMLIYNAGVALYLAAVGTVGPMRGVLLWPAVVLHAIVAFLLLRTPSAGISADRTPAP